jgi:serine/threonine protein kinase
MEFLPGGDLTTMLIKYDSFSEDVTLFYMAECILAIEAVHNLGYIHRYVSSPFLMTLSPTITYFQGYQA